MDARVTVAFATDDGLWAVGLGSGAFGGACGANAPSSKLLERGRGKIVLKIYTGYFVWVVAEGFIWITDLFTVISGYATRA